MFVVKLLVDELIIDVNLPRTALIVLVEIIYGHIFDKQRLPTEQVSRKCYGAMLQNDTDTKSSFCCKC